MIYGHPYCFLSRWVIKKWWTTSLQSLVRVHRLYLFTFNQIVLCGSYVKSGFHPTIYLSGCGLKWSDFRKVMNTWKPTAYLHAPLAGLKYSSSGALLLNFIRKHRMQQFPTLTISIEATFLYTLSPHPALSRFSSFIVQKLAHLSRSKKIGII